MGINNHPVMGGDLTVSSNPSSFSSTSRIADHLEAARQGRFVGREAELALFRSALLTADPPFIVLHLYGPGGVGKTALLHKYARLAADAGRTVVGLDGRNVEATPAGFLIALYQAMGLPEEEMGETAVSYPSNLVLLIDTYETLTALDGWLRETFLPQLPGRTLVVIAGRNPLTPAWRSDMAWADLTHTLPLGNLHTEESLTYLTVRGIPQKQHADVLAFTHGHPLALSLIADTINQGDKHTTFHPQNEPDVVRILLERFVKDIPSPIHRQALEVCVLAWATTETLLAHILGETEAPDLFAWLRQLSFIEQGPYGLFPHDVARKVMETDLLWRNPDSYQELNQRVIDYLRARFQEADHLQKQRLRLDIMYLRRHEPFMRRFFDWSDLDNAYITPASPADGPVIVDIVRQHQGEASAQLATYWLRRQPQAFHVFRRFDGELFGFMAILALHQTTPEDAVVDPAVPAALNFVQKYGPVQLGEEIIHLRFWMDRQKYQGVSQSITLTASSNVTYWLTHPKLAWNFIIMSDPDFWLPHFESINVPRAPEADFEIDGRHYAAFAHDWRVEPASVWQTREHPPMPFTQKQKGQPPIQVLSQAEFEGAVRQALRDYTRPDLLAGNPLLHSRIVLETAEPTPTALQNLLQQAITSLASNPKDEKLRRALWYTYIEPAPSQERAAEQLNLPFNTYRYHLANGLKRITAWLWQQNLKA